jgi:hypothetical protein
MTATAMADGDTALVVTATAFTETLGERFKWAAFPKVFSTGDDTAAKT